MAVSPGREGSAAAPTDLAWSEAIERVLAEPELVRPVFQPIVDLDRGVASGYEMLARFGSPIDATSASIRSSAATGAAATSAW